MLQLRSTPNLNGKIWWKSERMHLKLWTIDAVEGAGLNRRENANTFYPKSFFSSLAMWWMR